LAERERDRQTVVAAAHAEPIGIDIGIVGHVRSPLTMSAPSRRQAEIIVSILLSLEGVRAYVAKRAARLRTREGDH
jgi:hypothetical protein